ncbi:HAMP domain-containing protein [Alkaliphilus sp. B6464]|nr:HAMP domain-containing protein [Alkaliphilus sp. B6464]
MLVINIFVYETIKTDFLKEQKKDALIKANIISDSISVTLNKEDVELTDINLDIQLKEISTKLDGRVLIIDSKKKVIYDSFNDLRDAVIDQKEVVRALDGEAMVSEYILDKHKNTLYTSVPLTKNGKIAGVVLLSVSLLQHYFTINSIRNSLILISLIVLILITSITLKIATAISEPIKRLTQAMQNAAHGKLNENVPITGSDEISQLAKAYNFMNTKLSQIEKQRREFVANVSHELKTPLSSMKLLSESLLIQPNVEVEIYKDFLMDIDSEMDRLNKIIENLLNMVDMDEEKLHLDYKLTYVNYLLEKVVNSIKPLANEKNIKIILNQWEKIQIYLDQDKIHQALTNIIHNAVKYTEDSGKVEVSLFRRGQYAIIKISDNGIGIAEENTPYIFERFYRVDSARSRQTGGSGLGLAISHQIISLHQGTIEVESKINEGTTFYIKLPMEYMLGDKD